MDKVNEMILKVNNDILSFRNENLSLKSKIDKNNAKIDKLQIFSKQLRDETLDEWFKKNSLKKYYKCDDSQNDRVLTYYVEIIDEKAETYNWDLKKLIEDGCTLKAKYIEISYYTEGMDFDYAVCSNSYTITAYSILPERFTIHHNLFDWKPITEEEYLEAKKMTIDFIKNK